MTTFLGNIEVKADDKGRLFIPASYRKVLTEMASRHLIMRRDMDNSCLIFYPEQVWQTKVEQLRHALDEWSGEDEMLLMQFMAQAEVMDTDAQGRVLIARKQLDFLFDGHDTHGDNTLLFVGMMDRFALWHPAVFASKQLQSHELSDHIRHKMRLLPHE